MREYLTPKTSEKTTSLRFRLRFSVTALIPNISGSPVEATSYQFMISYGIKLQVQVPYLHSRKVAVYRFHPV